VVDAVVLSESETLWFLQDKKQARNFSFNANEECTLHRGQILAFQFLWKLT
jgi:hypothetical protein